MPPWARMQRRPPRLMGTRQERTEHCTSIRMAKTKQEPDKTPRSDAMPAARRLRAPAACWAVRYLRGPACGAETQYQAPEQPLRKPRKNLGSSANVPCAFSSSERLCPCVFTGDLERGVDPKCFQTEFPGTLRLLGLPSDIARGTSIGGELHLEQSFHRFYVWQISFSVDKLRRCRKYKFLYCLNF